MRSSASPALPWLSVRVRVLCVAAFAISLVMPVYTPESNFTPPDVDISARGYLLAEDGFLVKTSSLTEQGQRSAFSEGILHTVEAGESIASSAKSAFVSTDTIRWANGLKAGEPVKTGQKLLLLPVDGVLHTVKRGQNLKTIADLYGVSADRIAEQNKIRGGYLLAGQELIVPGGKPVVEIAAKPPALTLNPKLPPVNIKFPKAGEYTIDPSYGILQMPCDCFYTQYFSSTHFGVDLQHRGGSPVFAAEAGTVVRAEYGWNGGYGNVVEIDHGNGLITLYGHNKELYVQKGDTVTRGQAISFMGNTGRVHGPTGIHLHFEVHVNGVKKNPMIYLAQ
jgi:LysM repeat protein